MILTIPLFPLNTVLFPGGVLPLRIFEPRYLDMVSNCLRSDTRIGVILIKNGSEVGEAADVCDVGTLTTISYWNKRNDGLLGITLRGEKRFKVVSLSVEPNQLIMAEVEALPPEHAVGVTAELQHMVDLLKQIIGQLEPPYTTMPTHYDDAAWVSSRLVELLPLKLNEKQALLRLADPEQRLLELQKRLHDKVFV